MGLMQDTDWLRLGRKVLPGLVRSGAGIIVRKTHNDSSFAATQLTVGRLCLALSLVRFLPAGYVRLAIDPEKTITSMSTAAYGMLTSVGDKISEKSPLSIFPKPRRRR